MRKSLLYYLLIIIFLLCSFRLIDYLVFKFIYKNAIEIANKYPPNSEYISISSDFVYLSEINSWGIRNDELGKKTKPRILFLGDSFIYGVGVEKEERMTEVLSNLLKKSNLEFDIVNAGVIGTCPRDSYILYRDLNAKVSPDFVVLNIYTNDVYESGDNFIAKRAIEVVFEKKKWLYIVKLFFPKTVNHLVHFYLKSTFLTMQADAKNTIHLQEKYNKNKKKTLQKIKLSEKEIESKLNIFLTTTQLLTQIIGISLESFETWKALVGFTILRETALGRFSTIHVLYGLADPLYYKHNLELNDSAKEEFEIMTDAITALKSETEKNNQKLILTYIPSEFQYDSDKQELGVKLGYNVDKTWLTSKSQLEIALEEFSNSKGIPYFSMTEHFRKNSSKKLVWKYDIHWNQNGNIVAAEALSPFLQNIISK